MQKKQDIGWAVAIFLILSTGLTACAGAASGGLLGAGLGMGLSVFLMVIGVGATQTSCILGPCLSPEPPEDWGQTDTGPCLGAPLDYYVNPDATNPDVSPDSGPADVGPCLGAPLDIGPCLGPRGDWVEPDAAVDTTKDTDTFAPLDIGPCLSDLGPDSSPDAPVDFGPCLDQPFDAGEPPVDLPSPDGSADQANQNTDSERSRMAVLERLIHADKLPRDVAQRLSPKKSDS